MGIISGGLGGTHLVTQGYGYVAIIVPSLVRGKAPRKIYIDRVLAIPLEEVGILQEYDTRISLNSVPFYKLIQINKKIHELKIVLPSELQVILNKISLIADSKIMLKVEEIDKIIKGEETIFYIDIPSIVSNLRKYIKAKELIELIDEI